MANVQWPNKQFLVLLLGTVVLYLFECEMTVRAEPMKLRQAIEIVQNRNPDIRNYENQIQSIEAKARQTLAPSTPFFSLTYNDMLSALTPGGAASTVLQLTQPLGFPGKAFLSYSAIRAQADGLRSQLRATQLGVATSVKTAYYQLALAKRNIELNHAQRDAYERILAIAKRRYEAGSITQVDFLNSEVTLYSNFNDLADLNASEVAARAQLNVLLGNSSDAELETEPFHAVLPPLRNRVEALDQMTRNRPEVRAATFQTEVTGQNHKLAWMSGLPDFQFTVGTTFYNIPGASPVNLSDAGYINHTFLAMVQLTVPLWFFFNERESIVSTSHDQAAAEANLNSVLNQSKIAFETTIRILEALRNKIENYEKHLLPLSEQSFLLALTNYTYGKIDFGTLAITALTRRNSQRDYFVAVTSYLINYAVFGQLLGEDL